METEVLEAMYAAFNSRDMETVLAKMTPDVDWPNGQYGGRVHGHEAIRAYWTKQWQEIDPRVDPTSIQVGPESIVVNVHQVVRDLTGTVLMDENIKHVYTFQDGLIARMEIDPA